MPRPLRIEYENAYYHVMNRGRSRQKIFHTPSYYEAFLATLSEAHQRFGLQVLSYCLMSNHYHLIVKTPEANLGRAMRHINGVYTQRYNRMKKTDGSLFRGRYKAIAVEEDSYQLQLSRYIHRNPLEAKMVTDLMDYQWSSYIYYMSNKKAPDWLYKQDIIEQLGAKSYFKSKYRDFFAQGLDKEITQFYSRGNLMPFLGSNSFREWAYKHRDTDAEEITNQVHQLFKPSLDFIVKKVAKEFKLSEASIRKSKRGRVERNIARWVAMHIARDYSGISLKDIASGMGLKSTGSIPTTINKLLVLMESDKRVLRRVKAIRVECDI